MACDLRHGAVDRNSEAWPRWGVSVWPHYVVSNSYEDEIANLKQWLTHRIACMDTQLGYDPNAHVRGDVNGDGNVDVTDVTLLIGYVLADDESTSLDLDVADCNDDGTINISDVTRLIAYVLNGIWVE